MSISWSENFSQLLLLYFKVNIFFFYILVKAKEEIWKLFSETSFYFSGGMVSKILKECAILQIDLINNGSQM